MMRNDLSTYCPTLCYLLLMKKIDCFTAYVCTGGLHKSDGTCNTAGKLKKYTLYIYLFAPFMFSLNINDLELLFVFKLVLIHW